MIVEKNEFQIFNIIPLVREFFVEMKKNNFNIENTEWQDVINIMHNAYKYIITSYALSSVGRAE